MLDDSPNEDMQSAERYYINKRIDSFEVVVAESFRELQASIQELKGDIKDNRTQIHAVLLECQKDCNAEIKTLRSDVTTLQERGNKAVGAAAAIIFLIGLLKVI